jgi:NADPH-dependent ferric siderophore reductase
MAHLATCHSSGVIAQASGAAIAALQARAAAWEMPLIEQPDQIRLLIWGGELRLTPAASSMRIDLFAPEQRLIGVLRDSATEIFAEVGLTVDWQDLEVGALAPGLALMRVTDISRPSPSFLRVRLSGPEAARFAIGSLHFRLLLPQPGRAPVWPRVSASGRTLWPEGADALHRPVYTVRKQASDWLDFDIFRHPNSPTCDWAEADPLGQQVGILGPGGGGCPDAPRLRLFGDETALPAISRILHSARGEVRAVLRCAPEDLGPLAADPRVSRTDDLLAELQHLGPPLDGCQVWVAADKATAQAARAQLLAHGWPKKAVLTAAYW